MDSIWSNTDFPYMCLKDEVRTKAFHKAILDVVKKGDIVLDVGAGTGILSFFAAEAGAKKVYAVEIEDLLAEKLKESIQLNKLEKIIEVIHADATSLRLPNKIDVLVAEIIDTGLIDELQVPALNSLRKNNVITNDTTLIPFHYTTFAQLVHTDNTYYGYHVMAPKHEWPFYNNPKSGWVRTKVEAASNTIKLVSADFSLGIVKEQVTEQICFKTDKTKVINGLKISGQIQLSTNVQLGPTNALNGDKIIPIDPILHTELVKMEISYKMGGGLGSLKIKVY